MKINQLGVKRVANAIGIEKRKLIILLASCNNIGDILQKDLGAKDKKLESAFKAGLINQLYINSRKGK